MRSAAPLLLTAAACTQSGLQPIDDIQTEIVDNLIEIRGEVCTEPPEATDFPVKILFIIDGSGSMQFVDAPNRRALAVEEVILRTRANPSVSYAVIRFNESEVVLTKPGAEITAADPFGVDLSGSFTRDPAVLQTTVQGLRVADSVTDYQGAFSAAFRLLLQDMLAAPPAQRGRTKYVVLFLSDGDPFPTCCSRQSEQNGLCRRDTNIFFCEDPEAIRTNPTQLPYLVAGEDYNQPYQIFAAAQDIVDLAQTFTVGELRIHTAFLFDPSLASSLDANGCYVIGGVNFVCPDEARGLLGGVADIGDGIFRDFSRAEEIDFLSFDLLSIKRENAMKNLIVTNTNLRVDARGLVVDSDGDGVPDDVEFAAGMNRVSRDSDGDGFSDTLEWHLRHQGFEPATVDLGCSGDGERIDLDADGLAECEERLLRTSVELFDTDADGLPDGLELELGTDPAVMDSLRDADLDGVRNGDEARLHTSVGFEEGPQRPGLAYRYRTEDLGLNEDGQRCYAFFVKNVQLGTPLARPSEPNSFGRNDIAVYMAEAPFDDPNDFGRYKVACVRARYVAPDFKDPPDGLAVLTPADFVPPDALTPEACVGFGAEGTP